MSQLKIRLLSTPQVILNDVRLSFDSRKAVALLAYAAVTASHHTRDELAALFWPDADAKRARGSLRTTLFTLKKQLTGPWLHIEDDRIFFDADANTWIDVVRFRKLLEKEENHCLLNDPDRNNGFDVDEISSLGKAVDLYSGDFLSGFSLRGSPEFDEWQLFEREDLRRTLADALQRLTAFYAAQNEFATAIRYARRWLKLDTYHEPAHQELMKLYAATGQWSEARHQYQNCQRILADELGVPPSPETEALYDAIRTRQFPATETFLLADHRSVQVKPKNYSPSQPPQPSLPLPRFLQTEPTEETRSTFVARELELERMGTFLEKALAGNGQIVFIRGDAGSGKTSLFNEFTRLAQTRSADLVTTLSNCSAFGGVGDPYLPFREMLNQLTGELNHIGLSRQVNWENSRRLWSVMPNTVEALLVQGTNLIGSMVPDNPLLMRVENYLSQQTEWHQRLHQIISSQQALAAHPGRLEQQHIFQQATNVLNHVASVRPLMLVIDDLQWADVASINLLFHLSRRIASSPILIVGAYRPEDVAQGRPDNLARGDGRHPLEPVLNNLQRYWGDIWVDLDELGEERGQRFVDALLDAEPNDLDEEFRQTVYQRTRGHALFTIELLEILKERQQLWRDESGRWVSEPNLDWHVVPMRVEGVLKERVGRLSKPLRRTLNVASVEGEDFTAEVVARVEKVSDLVMVRRLSNELHQTHDLVYEQGSTQIDQQYLSLYRFRHNLFQRYIYDHLTGRERLTLHASVGYTLEVLYGRRTDEIAGQLGWHFEAAQINDKARHYLHIAGKQAAAQAANNEALDYFNRALSLTPLDELPQRSELLIDREGVYSLLGDREAQQTDLDMLTDLMEQTQLPRLREKVLLRKAQIAILQGNFQEAEPLLTEVSDLAAESEHEIDMIAVNSSRGYMAVQQGDYEAAERFHKEMLSLCQSIGNRVREGQALGWLGVITRHQGNFTQAIAYYEQCLAIYQETGYRRGEGETYGNLGNVYSNVGDYDRSRAYHERDLAICREIGDRLGEGQVLSNLGTGYSIQGNHAAALEYHQESLTILREVDYAVGIAYSCVNVATEYLNLNNFDSVPSLLEEALAIGAKIDSRFIQALAQLTFGRLYLLLGDYRGAKSQLDSSRTIFQGMNNRVKEMEALLDLGYTISKQGDHVLAQTYLQQGQSICQEIGNRDGAAKVLHTLAEIAFQRNDYQGAEQAYQEVLTIWQTLELPHKVIPAWAGLAEVKLAQGDVVQAQSYVEQILEYMETDPKLDAVVHCMRVRLICYRVLYALQDRRAEVFLERAHTLLSEHAAKIGDEARRQSYLENVPEHRAILAHWAEVESRSNLVT
ncbi:tetratricopeptide repeat protein [Chloroflexi bacterium TSY]|nr:tetratricopeptide repeat protein [Chloroflexi bacterium TSY]